MKTFLAATVLVLVTVALAGPAFAHCQVPCGIYDDAARIASMKEDASTIAKAMKNITKLSGEHHDHLASNQLIRWINTKEEHASHVIEIVSEYFLTQKLKPVAAGEEGRDAYLAKLADHHAVMRAAMKTKQSLDKADVDALIAAVDAMAAHW